MPDVIKIESKVYGEVYPTTLVKLPPAPLSIYSS